MGCVRRRGKSWNAQVRVAGWQSFTKSFGKKSDAVRWVQELEQTLKNSPLPRVNANDVSLLDLLQRYGLEVSSQLKGSEKELYKLNLYARHPIAQNRLSNLTPLHFEHLRDERLKQVSSGTVHADFMLLRRVFKTALRKWGYGLSSNPIEQVQIPSPHKPRKRRLIGDEKERLLAGASSQRNIYITPIIEFAIETGMRRSEILNLRWVDVDLDSGFASLFDTKNGEDRRVPLTKTARNVLSKLPKQD